ncbi:hypothetical protein KJ765_05500 [Candidatus Micrarchaeota archaeon]|nr:hypothetical protein [Candidatus Micrarchaeota archaeon]
MAIASAPGKIVLIGAYAVLKKPNISYVAAVDKRVFALAEKILEKRFVLEAPPLDVKEWGVWNDGTLELDADEDEKKKLRFLRAAVEACLKYFEWKQIEFRGIRVETWNDPAFGAGDRKTGMGSSAAAVVATIAAVFLEHGLDMEENKDAIHKLAQYANFIAQEKIGSGIDVAGACYGSIAYSRYSDEIMGHSFQEMMGNEWDQRSEPLQMPKGMRLAMAYTGKSANTRDLVKKVDAFEKKKEQAFLLLMEALNAENDKAMLWLKKMGDLSRKSAQKYGEVAAFFDGRGSAPEVAMYEEEMTAFREFKHAFAKGRQLTKQLGVESKAGIESDEASALIEESEERGAFVCTMPGAGGGDSLAALCLSEESKKKLMAFWSQNGLHLLDITFSGKGMQEETMDTWEKRVGETGE